MKVFGVVRLPNVTIIEEKHRYMYICMHICSHMRLFLPYVFIRFGAYPNHMHIQIIVKNNLLRKKERKIRKNRKGKHNSTD
jgi:hypothetical protein